MNPSTPNQEIAEGLRKGSPDAFRALYEAQGGAVLTYLTRLTGRKEMAEELTQETFLTAIRKIAFFRAQADGGLKAWIFRIATNSAIDLLRREKRFEFSTNDVEAGADDSPGPQEELERFQFSQALSKALLELTPTQRMFFLLKEQEEMSLLEISRVCGCSENAIKQSLSRARGLEEEIMRMKEADFEKALRRSLGLKPGLSPTSEAALFARAEELLSTRRERLHASDADARRMSRARGRVILSSRQFVSRMYELLAIHPNVPAVAATLAILVIAFVALVDPRMGHRGTLNWSDSDLPDFPKFNDAPARYDAQRLAERQAYEREVEDVHQKNSGGI